MTRKVAYSKQQGGPTTAAAARVQAYKRLWAGNGNQQDADIVLTDLSVFTGFHRRPVFDAAKDNPEAFLLKSALANARTEVVQHILDSMEVSDDVVIELERAARAEARR